MHLIIIIIVYLVSVYFTVSEAIYPLTLGYHGIASPIYTYRLHFFYFIKPFICDYVYNISLIFVCLLRLLFSLFSYKPLLYSCLTIYHVLISLCSVLFPYIPVKHVSHLLPLNIRDIFPYQYSVLLPTVAMSLLLTTLFHSSLFSNSILCTTS